MARTGSARPVLHAHLHRSPRVCAWAVSLTVSDGGPCVVIGRPRQRSVRGRSWMTVNGREIVVTDYSQRGTPGVRRPDGQGSA